MNLRGCFGVLWFGNNPSGLCVDFFVLDICAAVPTTKNTVKPNWLLFTPLVILDIVSPRCVFLFFGLFRASPKRGRGVFRRDRPINGMIPLNLPPGRTMTHPIALCSTPGLAITTPITKCSSRPVGPTNVIQTSSRHHPDINQTSSFLSKILKLLWILRFA